MLFSTKPKDISMERMMTSVPGFPPKGHGFYVFDKFKYTAENCDCKLCPHFKKKKCKLPKCECIASGTLAQERIEAAMVGYAEFMKCALSPIKNRAFQKRFAKYLIAESEMKSMPYTRTNGTFWRSVTHREMFERAIERSLNSDNSMLLALYLLTADKYLWSKVKYAISNDMIDFSDVKLKDCSIDAYTLYMTARDLYCGTKHITVSDLSDTELISNKMFCIIINAMAIRRYGMKAIEIMKKEGATKV